MITDAERAEAIIDRMTTSRTVAQNLAQTPGGYRDLRVWRAAIELVAESYRLTSALPAAERFGLSAQIQRAAVAIPANIAEGHEPSPGEITPASSRSLAGV